MEHCSNGDLLKSLVGATMEFRFSDKENSVMYLKTITTERKIIEKDVSTAHRIGGGACLRILAEMLDFYRREAYYMAVRSSIVLKRQRPSVLEYLDTLSVDERCDRLLKDLKKTGDREYTLLAVKYFLRSFPSRLKNFKEYLSKEELFYLV